MKTEEKKAWVEALRSGDYAQGIGGLRCNGRYCCLGVLADRFHLLKGGPKEDGWVENGSLESTGILPLKILERFGLTTSEQGNLVAMNDGLSGKPQHTFTEIADYIEDNL